MSLLIDSMLMFSHFRCRCRFCCISLFRCRLFSSRCLSRFCSCLFPVDCSSLLYVVSVTCSSFAITHPSMCSFVTIVGIFKCVRLFTKQLPLKHNGLRNLELRRWIILRYHNELMCLRQSCLHTPVWETSVEKVRNRSLGYVCGKSPESMHNYAFYIDISATLME